VSKKFSVSEYIERRGVLHEMVPLWAPFQFIFLISSVCNFRCKYCIQAKQKEIPVLKYHAGCGNFIKYNDYCYYIDSIAEHINSNHNKNKQKIKVLSFSGFGETLMHSQLADMIKYAKDKNIAEDIRIFTNASLLTHEMSDKLINAGVDELKISIQGVDAEDYKRVCGYDIDFNNFIDNIAYFYKNRRDCRVYIKIADLALIKEKKAAERFEEIYSPIADKINIEHITPGNAIPYTEGYRFGTDGGVMGDLVDSNVCNNVFRLLELQIDGEMYPCARYDDTGFPVGSIGNLKEKPFGDLWNKGKHKQLCVSALTHKMTGVCAGCKYFNFISSQKDVLDGHEDEILLRLSS